MTVASFCLGDTEFHRVFGSSTEHKNSVKLPSSSVKLRDPKEFTGAVVGCLRIPQQFTHLHTCVGTVASKG
jgi:hypothetical protein